MFGLFFMAMSSIAQEWQPIRELDLEVEANSLLDFSNFAGEAPAGKFGWAKVLRDGYIGFENRMSQQRFFCASFAFSKTSGGMPNHAEAGRIATQLRRTGYNAIRLHFLDNHLMTGRNQDLDFDPEQYERFQYFLYELKLAGIYWIIDVLDSDNGAYGGVYPHRWINKHHYRIGLYTDPEKQQHWVKILEKLLGQTNPYTQSVPLKDPALLGLILVNEGGVAELSTRSGGRYSIRFAPLFRQWLAKRYGTDKALAAAWGGALKEGESLAGIVEVPAGLRDQDARGKDFMRFVTDLEVQRLNSMTETVRRLGFKGLVTANNNWGFFQTDVTRSAAQWVDMHSYHGLPSDFVTPGSKLPQTSAIANGARFVRELTGARQWGKPFSVTEYGQPFWNARRRESVALVPAFAALHDWDLITLFSENSLQLDLRPSPYSRKNAIHPFGVSNDPILRTGERLAALLYKRGDVGKSGVRLHFPLDAERAFAERGGWAQINESVSRLSLLAASGIDIVQAGKLEGIPLNEKDYWVPIGSASTSFKGRVGTVLSKLGLAEPAMSKAELQSAGVLPNTNQSDFSREFYQSDTGEIGLDIQKKRFTVLSSRLALVTMEEGTSNAGALKVSKPSRPVLVAFASMDAKPLNNSRKFLMFVLTDAQNTGMEFKDEARTELKTLGTLPPMLQSVSLEASLQTVATGSVKVYSLSLAGKRLESLPASLVDGAINISLDTSMLKNGPATMFEVLIE